MIVLIIIVMFVAVVVIGAQQAKRRRAPLLAQMDSLRMQMQTLQQQGSRLDEKTAARLQETQSAVTEKLSQANQLIGSASKERHYERIARLLEQTQTKVTNAQASVQRAQERFEAREGRRMEAETRRAQRSSFAGQGATPGRRGGSFGPPPTVTNAQTDWNTIPANERGVSFFSGRPALLRELTPVTVPIGGRPQKVLVDARDYALLQSGQTPPVRVFTQNGRSVPWYAHSSYDPYRDYYMSGYDDDWLAGRLAFDLIDSLYWDFHAPVYDGYPGGGYVFTPDAEAYQDYASAQAAGSVDYNAYDGGPAFPTDFAGGDSADFAAAGMMPGGIGLDQS